MDIVLVNPPLTRIAPPVGLALIKASVEASGFSCKILDWNLSLWDKLNSENEITQNEWDKKIVDLYHSKDVHLLWGKRGKKTLSRLDTRDKKNKSDLGWFFNKFS